MVSNKSKRVHFDFVLTLNMHCINMHKFCKWWNWYILPSVSYCVDGNNKLVCIKFSVVQKENITSSSADSSTRSLSPQDTHSRLLMSLLITARDKHLCERLGKYKFLKFSGTSGLCVENAADVGCFSNSPNSVSRPNLCVSGILV